MRECHPCFCGKSARRRLSCRRSRCSNDRSVREAATPRDPGSVHVQQFYEFLLLDDLHGHSESRRSQRLFPSGILFVLRRRVDRGDLPKRRHRHRPGGGPRCLHRCPQLGLQGPVGKNRGGGPLDRYSWFGHRRRRPRRYRDKRGRQQHRRRIRHREQLRRGSLLLRRNDHVYGGLPVPPVVHVCHHALPVLGTEHSLEIPGSRPRDDRASDRSGKTHSAASQSRCLYETGDEAIACIGRLLRRPAIDRLRADANHHDLFGRLVFRRCAGTGHRTRSLQRQRRGLADLRRVVAEGVQRRGQTQEDQWRTLLRGAKQNRN
mmetsp:Transcript_16270/g.33436  ORF Transcript_16270/g.33436 Transcript_16270/m.33436 type:complete len:319 (+) Transcript_16270:735-1691(+)